MKQRNIESPKTAPRSTRPRRSPAWLFYSSGKLPTDGRWVGFPRWREALFEAQSRQLTRLAKEVFPK